MTRIAILTAAFLFFTAAYAAPAPPLLAVNVPGSLDTDGDGVPDVDDNCLVAPNPSQYDSNGDGFGNACDPDINNDLIVNFLDLQPIANAFFTRRADIAWNPHADLNNDGIVNLADLEIFRAKFFDAPGPSLFEPATLVPASYAIEDLAVGSDGIVYLFARADRRIYRWSINEWRYWMPIELNNVGAPTEIAYSPTHDRVYIGHADGAITYVDINGTLDEQAFGFVPGSIGGVAAVGNYLLVQDPTGAWDSHHIFDIDGTLTDSVEWNQYSRDYAWNETLSRVYFFRDGSSPNDLHWEQIDQVTGLIIDDGETPYHGDYTIAPPIRISHDDTRVLLGSGDIYDALTLEWLGALPVSMTDGQWLDNGGVVTIRSTAGETTLERRDPAQRVVETTSFAGDPAAIDAYQGNYFVVTIQAGQPLFHAYTPNDDTDGDGVPNTDDAFPDDPAASVDSDGDGYPDAWNPGMSADDSTTGLVLDAYPFDSACFLPEHGDGVVCDVTSTLPAYVPDVIEMDANGIVHLLSTVNNRVYRWDSNTGEHLNPIIVGSTSSLAPASPDLMAYSPAHNRIYLAYDSGEITYVEIGNSAEQPFATTAQSVGGLAAVGEFVLAQDASGAWNTHYIYDINGVLTDSLDWNRYSRVYAWNPVLNRVYFFRDGISPNDLHYEDIDQVTGMIVGEGETPYHGSYPIVPPIRVSHDGMRVMLGSGDIYDATSLEWLGSLPSGFNDAQWSADGGTVVLIDNNGETVLQRRSASAITLEVATYPGVPFALLQVGADYLVVTLELGEVVFHTYVPNDDSDGDGVPNIDDAFPLDPAASVDTDGDGYPDEWNPGMTADDSTTGLVLDAYPDDSACYLPGHGDGVVCDVTSTMPDYVPDVVEVDNSGIVYLLSQENNRVFRWDSNSGEHLNPLLVGSTNIMNTSSPSKMAYSAAHDRLYFAYDSGAITYIETGDIAEQPFAATALSVGGLVAVGEFMLAQDSSGAWYSHYIFDVDGVLTDSEDWNRYSRAYAWNPVLSRVYFFRDATSPNDLHYEDIDQVSGMIVGEGETPYHGSYAIVPPIRVSQDGAFVMLGSGDIYDAASLEWVGSLPAGFEDGQWIAGGGTVTLREFDGTTVLERRDAGGSRLELLTLSGTPAAIVPGVGSDVYVVVTQEARPAFTVYTPNDDTDGDGVSNTEDAFPTDPAASVDSDGDGYPDAWNPGMTAADSTTGLILDAYPNDSACFLPEHGDGVTCDVTSTLPDYAPDVIETTANGVVHLLSTANNRIYRWDATTGQHLNPFAVGSTDLVDARSPIHMAYAAAQSRLYFGYDSGAITYIDLTTAGPEQSFAATAFSVGGMVAVGNYLLAQDASGAWDSHNIFDINGVLTDSVEWNHDSIAYGWNDVLSRVYYFGFGDLLYEDIDQATGIVIAEGQAPFSATYSATAPIRVSPDGGSVMLGGGDIFDAQTVEWLRSLPNGFTDGQINTDGSTVTIAGSSAGTMLERRDASGTVLEVVNFTGTPVALARYGTDYVVVTQASQPEFVVYTPSDDTDGDGVPNIDDAFPDDPAASADSDGDGYPDAWNPGMSADDSTTGLVLDAYPSDSACYLPEHGDGVICDVTSTLPNYAPDVVAIDDSGIIYLLSTSSQRIYRWDSITGVHLNPIVVGMSGFLGDTSPGVMTYSPAHNRLYLGYDNGSLTYVDLSGSPGEQDFSAVPSWARGMTAAGDYLYVYDGTTGQGYTFDAAGNNIDSANGRYSRDYAWNPVYDRVYYFRDGTSPNDIHYTIINPLTGMLGTSTDSPYHGDYTIAPPIRVSDDGVRVLIGTGNIFNGETLTWMGALPLSFHDARWTADGGTVTMRLFNSETLLERRDADGAVVEFHSYPGSPTSILSRGGEFVVVTQGLQPQFTIYAPSDDVDGDGVPNVDDAFPTDPAASVDSDADGYPDAWNPGMTGADSTTGLVLDAYPSDSACYLPEHGDGVTCDVTSTLPDYYPDAVEIDANGIVYLLSTVNNRVFRWDAATSEHMNPIIVGSTGLLDARSPMLMTYSPAHDRLYFAYDSGSLTYLDLNGDFSEENFATTSATPGGIAAVGNFVLAQDPSGAWNTHYIFAIDGTLTDSEDWNRRSSAYAWNPQLNRVYFFRDGTSPNDLHYEDIDQATGLITADGDSPYHGTYLIRPPIRVSADGLSVLLGSGDFYDAASLTWTFSLPSQIHDARWMAGGNLLTLRASGSESLLESWDTGYTPTGSQVYNGSPIALLGYNETTVVITTGPGGVGTVFAIH